MDQPQNTAILIPVHNHLEYTRKCLVSLSEMLSGSHLKDFYHIVIIDDGSHDGTGEYIGANHPEVHIVNGDGNLWWSGAVNLGAKYAVDRLKSDYLLLWNNDVIVPGAYFEALYGIIQGEDGERIIGSKIYSDYEAKRLWSMGGKFNKYTGKYFMIGYGEIDQGQYPDPMEVEWITGMGTLVPAKILMKIGYWDSKNFPQYHGDLEFTYRAYVSGYKLVVHPGLVLVNDIRNTGLRHNGEFRKFVRLFYDKRSIGNFKVNVSLIRKYGKGPFAYRNLARSYIILILSYLKAVLNKPFKK